MHSALGLKILFVEDNDEIRDALATLLEGEGYDVTPCVSAEEALTRLKTQGAYHLVVTDYALPGNTGAWLIEQGVQAGLIDKTRALVVTAHPNPKGLSGVRVIHKPVDLDDFLREVYEALAPARATELERARSRLDAELRVPRPATTIELALYISSTSPTSLKAIRNVEKILSAYDSAHVKLAIVDLSKERSALADEDKVAFTPTLVKRRPTPRAWVLGDLENGAVLVELLAGAGLERKS